LKLLIEGNTRLLTLTGPGGVGKTRLALRIAQEAVPALADEAVFVPLATLTDPALVLPTIVRTLGLGEDPSRHPAELLATHLCGKRLLLVLDNVEQVRPAATQLVALVAACPNLVVVVTSRVPLHVGGEQRFPVPALALPDPTLCASKSGASVLPVIASSPAVQLFVTRAQAVAPRFTLDVENAGAIASICQRLGGLPLAIELAAARIDLLCPAELLAGLTHCLPLLTGGPHDAPDRLRTMRHAISWSYDLLSPDAQAHFRRLSIFAGGFIPTAAEFVLGAEPSAMDRTYDLDVEPGSRYKALDDIASLLDKSLLQRTEAAGATRFAMPEVIREFARERLDASGETDTVARQHGTYYLALTESLTRQALPGNQIVGLECLEAEQDNLRVALNHFEATSAFNERLRLAAACAPFWFARGHVREGWARLRDALATGRAGHPILARGRALIWAVELALPTGDRQIAAILGEESIEVWRTIGDPCGLASALHALALVVEQQLQWEAATVLLEEELALRRMLGDPLNLGITLVLLGGVAYGQGDLVRATELVNEARGLVRAAGSRRWTGLADWYLGMFAASKSRVIDAARSYRDSLYALSDVEDHICRFKPIVGLAAVAAELGCAETAAKLLGAADGLLDDCGMELYPFDRPAYEVAETTGLAVLGEEGFATAVRVGRNLSRQELLAETDAIVTAAQASVQVLVTSLPVRASEYALTWRESEVLRLLVGGNSDKEIAATLGIARRTASSHVAAIRAKLDAPSRSAAVAVAVRNDLV